MLILLLHQFAESLGNAIDAKDTHTRSHSDEVALVSLLLARTLGLSEDEAERVHVAGHLHDIGKIGVPDAVLLKAGALTAEEWRHMRAHPVIGARIVSPVAELAQQGVADMILHHHERWDGTGYPHGLSGRGIPLGARIIALADSLSAMLQQRPYRPAMRFEDAEAELLRCSGSQFDPDVVQAFAAARGTIRLALTHAAPVPEHAAGTARPARVQGMQDMQDDTPQFAPVASGLPDVTPHDGAPHGGHATLKGAEAPSPA